jgi:hypothetical protein
VRLPLLLGAESIDLTLDIAAPRYTLGQRARLGQIAADHYEEGEDWEDTGESDESEPEEEGLSEEEILLNDPAVRERMKGIKPTST